MPTRAVPAAIPHRPRQNPGKISKPGYGIPMKALSTNCLYYNAYLTADKMARQLNLAADPQWPLKAERLKKAINARLWNERLGNYRYLVGPFGPSDLSGGPRLVLRPAVRHRRRPVGRGHLRQPARHPGRHPLRLARTAPRPAARRHVVRPALRHGLAANPGLLGRGCRTGGQAQNLRPRAVQPGLVRGAGQAVCRVLPSRHRPALRRPSGSRTGTLHGLGTPCRGRPVSPPPICECC